MNVAKPGKNLSFLSKGYGMFYRAIFVVLLFVFASNFSGFNALKSGVAFADEENATNTVESIISTSTISDLTSDDSIAETISLDNPAENIFSEIILPITEEISSTTEENISTSSETSFTEDEISTTTEENLSEEQASTTAEIKNETNDNQASSSDENIENASTTEETVVDEEVTEIENAPIEPQPTVSNVENNYEQFVIQTNTHVTKVISPILGGTFKSGVVPVIVSFNKNVFVTGTPQLVLATGNPATTKINYKSGSGSGFLIFTYSIKRGSYSDLLDYENSSSLLLNGGSIKDENGNDVDLTLPNPGSEGSLSDSSKITIKKI